MKTASLIAMACAALPLAAGAAPSNPFEAFHGKVKAGLYEYRTETDMGAIPGMPPGMGKQAHTYQNCVTPEDIRRGEMSKNDRMPKDCEVKDFRMSGNTATFRTVCTGRQRVSTDNKVTFHGDGYDMDMAMDMNEGGHPMHLKTHMQARYMGACSK